MDDRSKMHPNQIKKGEIGSPRSESSIPKPAGGPPAKNRYVDITAMIRSLQRTEGSSDCFRRGIADCDQLDCSWRQYCLHSTD